MGCFGPDAPNSRDYGQETADTLEAQVRLAPDLYAAESTYRPQYAQLDSRIARDTLLGAGGQPGLLQTYEDAQPALSRIAAADQESRIASEMDVINKYAGGVTGALRKASGNDQIMALLNQQAMAELGAGAEMDPALADQLSQQFRAAQAGRGMFAAGNPSASGEALMGAQRSEQLRRARQAFGLQVAGANQATSGDAFMALLGRPSQAVSQASGAYAQGAQFNPGNQFAPESPYAGNLYGSNQAYDWAYKQATPSTLSTIGQFSEIGGKFLGGVAGGIMGCWVAREVYGETSPRWRQFQVWLIMDSPDWLLKAYYRHGEEFAAWLRDKPRLKRWIRRWMDRRIRKVEVQHA